MSEQRFRPRERLRKGADFRRVFQRGKVLSDRVLRVHACCNGLAYNRLGLAVSRRVGSAVRRNRFKRLMREAFRLSKPELPTGYDLVLIPSPTAEPSLGQLRESLTRLAHAMSRRLQGETKP